MKDTCKDAEVSLFWAAVLCHILPMTYVALIPLVLKYYGHYPNVALALWQ